MRKVLIIAYAYPPHLFIGSQRPYKLAKYFLNYGWNPIVLTVKREGSKPNGIELIETDITYGIENFKTMLRFTCQKNKNKSSDSFISLISNRSTSNNIGVKLLRETIKFPDAQKGWFKYAFKSASAYMDKEKVDIIISTSSPVTSHLIARALKIKYNIPWIADFRDLWTQNHFYNKFGIIKFFERRLELKTLSDADTLVTVTPRFVDKLSRLHKDKKIICITNGYDPDDFSDVCTKLSSKFSITYTGSLYNGKMDPSLLFKVVSTLINENKVNRDLIELNFYSRDTTCLLQQITKYNLEDIVKCRGYIQRDLVLEKQKESQILLLLVDKDTRTDYYPAKVFEYFGARRPIIALGGEGGVVQELLEKNNVGIFINNHETLHNMILKYYDEFITRGEVNYHENENITNYTYTSIAKEYADVLNQLLH